MEKLYKLKEVAEILGINRETLRRIVKRNEIALTIIGSRNYRITETSLQQYVELCNKNKN